MIRDCNSRKLEKDGLPLEIAVVKVPERAELPSSSGSIAPSGRIVRHNQFLKNLFRHPLFDQSFYLRSTPRRR
jgi:hypothetical protein